MTLVFAGSTADVALRVKIGQPPVDSHAARSGYRLVPVAISSAQRTASSLMSNTSTTSMPGALLRPSLMPSSRRCRLVAP
jgi:hypothetical protein